MSGLSCTVAHFVLRQSKYMLVNTRLPTRCIISTSFVSKEHKMSVLALDLYGGLCGLCTGGCAGLYEGI